MFLVHFGRYRKVLRRVRSRCELENRSGDLAGYAQDWEDDRVSAIVD